tara:strand:+ start:257 stop:616 length:360 start_codon:yes stop_codon:yes gene_type:complete
MRKTAKKATTALSLAALFTMASLIPMTVSADAKKGKEIAWDRKKGNCLACHAMPGAVSPGNFGPPLAAMITRFPNRNKLFMQIYDSSKNNPNTTMPLFGKYEALSASDIQHIVDYLYTL